MLTFDTEDQRKASVQYSFTTMAYPALPVFTLTKAGSPRWPHELGSTPDGMWTRLPWAENTTVPLSIWISPLKGLNIDLLIYYKEMNLAFFIKHAKANGFWSQHVCLNIAATGHVTVETDTMAVCMLVCCCSSTTSKYGCENHSRRRQKKVQESILCLWVVLTLSFK